ncbi:MAG: hypothetical protein CME43_01265 [Haliea sp.]|nr:hypothetical protein [Haliea sp.]
MILSTRDVDKWYASTRRTIFAVTQNMPRWLLWLSPRLRAVKKMVTGTVWQGVFDGRFLDEDHAKRAYLRNIEDVKAHYPPDRLLIHQPGDGWEPICRFLGKDVPQEPYPRVNEAKEIQRVARVFKVLGYLPGLLLVLALIVWWI